MRHNLASFVAFGVWGGRKIQCSMVFFLRDANVSDVFTPC